ncbi:hypothetical protein ABK040_004261 [Willaertia magna]
MNQEETSNLLSNCDDGTTQVPWSTGLFDCFTDTEICLTSFFIPNIFRALTESQWRRTNPILNYFCSNTISFYHEVRVNYNLEGNACSDCLVGCFCNRCALSRAMRELKERKVSNNQHTAMK